MSNDEGLTEVESASSATSIPHHLKVVPEIPAESTEPMDAEVILPAELLEFKEPVEVISAQVARMAPMGYLLNFATTLFTQQTFSKGEARRLAKLAIRFALAKLEEDRKFQTLLDEIFSGKYPHKACEVWNQNGIAVRPYEGIPDSDKTTFKSKVYLPLGKPNDSLLRKIAPALFDLKDQDATSAPKAVKAESSGAADTPKDGEQQDGIPAPKGKCKPSATAAKKPASIRKGKESSLVGTRELDLIKKHERSAIARSALFEIDAQTRPTYGVPEKWRYQHGKLPVKVIPAQLICSDFDPVILKELFADMRNTFSLKDEESFANAVGYLITPIIAHLTMGQNPGFNFSGPSRSGKGYLSRVLVEILYCRAGPPSVYSVMVPKSLYELANNLYGARDAIYLVFDEVARIDADQFKLLDNLLTEVLLKARKMRHGYINIKNLFTVAITSVYVNLTDETAGRFANVELTASRATEIETFHRKWHSRGPELLAALYDAVNRIEIDPYTVPVVAHRRTGFAVLAHVLKEAFGLKTEFSYAVNSNDYLQWACDLYEDEPDVKEKSGWRDYSPTVFKDFLRTKKSTIVDDVSLATAMRTALTNEGTENHPAYSNGYPSSDGSFYHIRWKRTGIKQPRAHLFVKKIGVDHTDHTSRNNEKPAQKTNVQRPKRKKVK